MGALWVGCVVVAGGASAFLVITAPLAGAGDEIAPCLRSKATAHPLAMGPVDDNGEEQETETEAASEEGDDPTTLGGGANGVFYNLCSYLCDYARSFYYNQRCSVQHESA